MNYIDLTHIFTESMPVYPGDALPKLEQVDFINKDDCNTYKITTGMHVGTHMDGPLHMLPHGKRLSEFPVHHFFGNGHLIDARDKNIDVHLLDGKTIAKGDIVLIMTGFSYKFRTSEYYEDFPVISVDFAKRMIELGVSIVGMDTPSPDRPPFNIHKLLLESDILIIENLTNLESLLDHAQFTLTALPTKFKSDAAPVRVVAMTQ